VNIGIISKSTHAKSHIAALKKEGHHVVSLGGNPRKPLPPSLDVIVVRPASISHGGFDTGMEAKRDGRKVIIANGVTEMLNAVRELQPKPTKREEKKKDMSAIEVIHTLSEKLGVYGPALHTESAGPTVQALAGKSGAAGKEGFAVWKAALKTITAKTIQDRMRKSAPELGVTVAYTYPERGGVRSTGFVVKDEEAFSAVLSRLPVAKTEKEAIAKVEEMKAETAAKRKLPRKDKKAAKKVILTPPREKVLPPVVQPLPKAPPPPPPAPPLPAAWDAQLRSAIGLVLSEMRAAKVTGLAISSEGLVTFDREVVVVQTQSGSMKVGE